MWSFGHHPRLEDLNEVSSLHRAAAFPLDSARRRPTIFMLRWHISDWQTRNVRLLEGSPTSTASALGCGADCPAGCCLLRVDLKWGLKFTVRRRWTCSWSRWPGRLPKEPINYNISDFITCLNLWTCSSRLANVHFGIEEAGLRHLSLMNRLSRFFCQPLCRQMTEISTEMSASLLRQVRLRRTCDY